VGGEGRTDTVVWDRQTGGGNCASDTYERNEALRIVGRETDQVKVAKARRNGYRTNTESVLSSGRILDTL